MLKSRVSKHVDMGRLSKAVERAGIDPRIWTSLAIVEKIVVDPLEGVFVDVLLMPSLHHTTARLGAEYAGNGFGLYMPLKVDDEVLVESPSGDMDNGLVITRRLHSASDPPPTEMSTFPEDILLYAEANKTIRVIVAGAGNIVIATVGTGTIQLGGEGIDAPVPIPGAQGAVNGEALDAFTGLTQAAQGNASLVVFVKKLPG